MKLLPVFEAPLISQKAELSESEPVARGGIYIVKDAARAKA